ncbi:hypothetical protein PV11_03977 [Exophiala sideris]|uniref:RED-like N-terminal domain-containing protein n=1 Tax=Exophiala sideris TaxID=1016849 RepID=A0A0D1VZG2_9EURO|nr:hypothetical protein PV11_03977 [Exophiala sideris]
MDNSQFRNLVQNGRAENESPKGGDFKKPTLGSRSRNLMPMTPRSVAGYNASKDFARQVAEHRHEKDGQPPTKKFRSSATPKGTKFASGYQDRTLARRAEGDGEEVRDDKEKRVKALEEMYKLQQIDEATFNKLKEEIGIGGNLNSTHLVKGLDFKLLERVRRGEDVNSDPAKFQESAPEPVKADLDDELDQVLDKEVEANESRSKEPQSTSTESEQVEGRPMTRDEILAQLKQRRSGKEQVSVPAPVLNDRFRKVVPEKKSNKTKFIEVVNGRRREVLVINNKDGTTKRKSRWLDPEDAVPAKRQSQPLGMEVPAEFLAKQQAMLDQEAAEDDDDDIFAGAGDYDPLAGINSDSDDVDGNDDNSKEADVLKHKAAAPSEDKPRNYFGRSNDQNDEGQDRANPIMKDPTLLAALKRAAGLRQSEEQQQDNDDTTDLDPEKAARQQQLLARLKDRDRADSADMDLGFGESRFGDEDDDEGVVWEEGEGAAKKTGRKRGGKKRKGDKDSVGDVMAVLAGRKEEK